MYQHNYTIVPRKGFGSLLFGTTIDDTVSKLGEAQEIEQIDDEDIVNTVILHYWDQSTSLFFEGSAKPVLSCIETDCQEAVLFGSKVFELGQYDIINLMDNNGYTEYETDMEEGERRLSFEEGLIDFFFQDALLIAVNWGVMVTNEGEIDDF
jgi:hypothetical protein